MANFKFASRQATVAEIESLGFTVEGRFACCNTTGAWYDTEDFFVTSCATVIGEECVGQYLYVDDDLSGAEEIIADVTGIAARSCALALGVFAAYLAALGSG